MRALVIDDDAMIRMTVAAALSSDDIDVTAACDGPTALALLEHARFDLVLLDVMMPVMDGYTTLQSIRAKPGLRGMPVLMLTAKCDDSQYVRAYSSGADGFIAKPFDVDQLIATVWGIASLTEQERIEHRQRELARAVARGASKRGHLVDLEVSGFSAAVNAVLGATR